MSDDTTLEADAQRLQQRPLPRFAGKASTHDQTVVLADRP